MGVGGLVSLADRRGVWICAWVKERDRGGEMKLQFAFHFVDNGIMDHGSWVTGYGHESRVTALTAFRFTTCYGTCICICITFTFLLPFFPG